MLDLDYIAKKMKILITNITSRLRTELKKKIKYNKSFLTRERLNLL